MDNRKKIKTRKLKEEERRKKKEGMIGGEVLFKRKDKVIRRNDIIVSPFANKVKLENGENSNPVKQEDREEEDARGEEGVEVVTVDENEEPGVEQEWNAEMGHAMEVPSAAPTVPEAGPSSRPLGISSDPTAAPTPLQETVNYLVDVVGSMSAQLKVVRKKLRLSKVFQEMLPPQPSTSAGTSSQVDSPNMETLDGEDHHLDLARESRFTTEDGTGSKHCLVCYKDVPSPGDGVCDNRPLIDKQLEGIFVLNKLLCVPPTSLGKYLEMCPDANPASWINMCGECGEMVTKAWRIHDEIVNASKKLKGIQEQIINKIKLSTIDTQENDASQVASRDLGTVVTRESRKFVMEHEYGHFQDPFPLGDQEASRLLMDAKRRSGARAPKSTGRQEIEVVSVHLGKAPKKDGLHQNSNNVQASRSLDNANAAGGGARKKIRVTKSRNRIFRRKKSGKRLIDEEGAFYRDDGKISFRCQIEDCSKVYRNRISYRRHKLWHSSKMLQCKQVIHEKMLKQRESSRRWRQQFQRKCPHCEKITGKYQLAMHIKRVHEKFYQVTCGICGNCYINRNVLIRHEADRHGICAAEGCRLEFPGDKRGLRKHQLEAHGREINVFGCEDCGILFSRVEILRKHQKNDHGFQKG